MSEQMIPLLTQSQFEDLLKPIAADGKPSPEAAVVYFTASWCGACKKLDFNSLFKTIPKTIIWYKCDVDVNKYTLGYCGLTKIPSFVIIKSGKFLGKFSTSDTMTVFDTLKETFE
jgi:thiol-disulfide isomerase/thioredoxin